MILTPAQRLKFIENEIEDLLKDERKIGTKIGEKLIRVRDDELWKPTYKSFKDYVEKRWEHHESWAYRAMKATVVREQLTVSGLANSQARQSTNITVDGAEKLAKVPSAQFAAVAAEASKNGKITAKSVQQAVEQFVPQKKEKVFDRTGAVIPQEILPLWERQSEFEALIGEMTALKAKLKKLIKEDRLWGKVSDIAFEHAGSIASAVQSAMPYAVCMKCSGWLKTTQNGICPNCDHTGFMSKHQYDVWNDDDKRLRKNDNLPRLPTGVPRQNI